MSLLVRISACQIQAIGLQSSYAFPDSSFSTSSSSGGSEASKARLNGNGTWSPSTDANANDYLQIDLQYEYFICAVATQGNPRADHWTTKYKVLLSVNNIDWITYQENNADKVRLNALIYYLPKETWIIYYLTNKCSMKKIESFISVVI